MLLATDGSEDARAPTAWLAQFPLPADSTPRDHPVSGALERLLLGRVSEGVLRHVDRPVLIVKTGAHGG